MLPLRDTKCEMDLELKGCSLLSIVAQCFVQYVLRHNGKYSSGAYQNETMYRPASTTLVRRRAEVHVK